MPGFFLAIVGPTASGKTALAVELAERTGAEVLGCDAYQLRAGLDVLTAKPTAAERQRVPHHLIGALPLREVGTAARYAALTDAVLKELFARGRPAIVCGGTGLYLRALAEGLFPGPAGDAALRQQLRAEAQAAGVPGLHDRLRAVDPEAAARIARTDYVRIERALEVFLLTGRPISALQAEGRRAGPRYEVVRVGLDPGQEALSARIRARTEAMLQGGALEEVAQAVQAEAALGPLPNPPLGYELIRRHLHGALSCDELCDAVARETAQYARRQRRWFKREAVRLFARPEDVPMTELSALLVQKSAESRPP